QYSRKEKEQQISKESDSGDHEDQQQNHLEVCFRFVKHIVRGSEAEQQRLNHKQPAGLQRVTLERHREREDELEQQHPAGNEAAGRGEEYGIENQEADDRQLVPVRSLSEEQLGDRGERVALRFARARNPV